MKDKLRQLAQPMFPWLRSQNFFAIPRSIYQHLHFEGDITIEVHDQAQFGIHHYGYQVENDLFWAGFGNRWEATSLWLWTLLAAQSDVIWDIGANTGVYSLTAKSVNPNSDVHAFEPVERIADRLRQNNALNGFDVSIVRAGISDQSGSAQLHEPETEHAYSASLNPDMLAGDNTVRTVNVPIIRGDDYFNERRLETLDLIKLDAEKHEAQVLAGLGALIQGKKPAFLIEVLDTKLGDQVSEFFDDSYQFFMIDEKVGLASVTKLGENPGNYLVCPTKLAAFLNLDDQTSHEEIVAKAKSAIS